MEPKKIMYLIGYFTEYGYFFLWNSNSIAFNETDANRILKEARLKSYNGHDYQIYRVKPEDMRLVEEDVGLKEFTLLKDLVHKEIETNGIAWFNDGIGFDDEIYIQGWWKYSPAKRLVTYEYEYRITHRACFMGNGGADLLHKVEDKIAEDLEKQCRYRMTPIIKRIMKERGLNHIRVEFRNKYVGGKIIKGFIENKGA